MTATGRFVGAALALPLSLALTSCGERAPTPAPRASAAPSSASAPASPEVASTSALAAGDATAARVAERRAKLGEGFFFEVDAPFVIAGDSARPQFDDQVETFRWAIEKLQKQFFERRPAVVTDVLLFRDAESYERHTRELFHEAPQSPYGYYLADKAALIMNIGTGGGTLVHEADLPAFQRRWEKWARALPAPE